MDKLIWPNQDHECAACPQCPCSNATDKVIYYVRQRYNLNPENMIYRSCYECECVWDSYAEDYGFDCILGGNQYPPFSALCPDGLGTVSAPTPLPTHKPTRKPTGIPT
eukprot:254906_1